MVTDAVHRCRWLIVMLAWTRFVAVSTASATPASPRTWVAGDPGTTCHGQSPCSATGSVCESAWGHGTAEGSGAILGGHRIGRRKCTASGTGSGCTTTGGAYTASGVGSTCSSVAGTCTAADTGRRESGLEGGRRLGLELMCPIRPRHRGYLPSRGLRNVLQLGHTPARPRRRRTARRPACLARRVSRRSRFPGQRLAPVSGKPDATS